MSRTVIVTPFGVPEQLAGACVLSGISGTVLPIGEFSAIVQEDTDIEAGNAAAARISQLTGKHEVLLLARTEDQIDAAHYRGGKRESDVPAGLALSNLPQVLERVLLGLTPATDVEDHISTSSISKMQASRMTMSPARAALARTALLWIVALVLALVVLGIGAWQALQGSVMGTVVCGLGVLVAAFALVRILKLLTSTSRGQS